MPERVDERGARTSAARTVAPAPWQEGDPGERSERPTRRALAAAAAVVALVALAALLGACADPARDDDSGGGGGEPLDCVRQGYPCRAADVPAPIFKATRAALEAAGEALAAGGMNDARAILAANPDVISLEVHPDGTALRFRFDGGAPAWLLDARRSAPEPTASSSPTRPASSEPDAAPVPSGAGFDAVVGSDTNGDGEIDNRDAKRALVLAPYLWEFGATDESPVVAAKLGALPPYRGNVDYAANEAKEDHNVTLEHWRSLDAYDAVFVSSHGASWKIAGELPRVVVISGLQAHTATQAGEVARTTGAELSYVLADEVTVDYALSLDFFRTRYPSGLTDALVVFSSCESAGEGGDDLADVLAGEDVVVMGWSAAVVDGAATVDAFVDELSRGLAAEAALERLRERGLDRGEGEDPKEGEPPPPVPVFTRMAPGGGDQRLIEIPTLLDRNGDPLEDGSMLLADFEGVIGDGANDRVTARVRVDGVVAGTEDGYELWFEWEGRRVAGPYGLADGVRSEDGVTVEREVDLGLDVVREDAEFAAVVHLPEGGESRYAVEVRPRCGTFSATADRSGFTDIYGEVASYDPPRSDPLSDSVSIDLLSLDHPAGFVDFTFTHQGYPLDAPHRPFTVGAYPLSPIDPLSSSGYFTHVDVKLGDYDNERFGADEAVAGSVVIDVA